MKIIFIILFTASAIICFSCSQTTGVSDTNQDGRLSIYLVYSFEKGPYDEPIIKAISISDSLILKDADIVWYDSALHRLKITDSKAREFYTGHWPVDGRAFVLVVDSSIIYTGYFWPSYSSLSCNWICIDPLNINGELKISLGYPSDRPDFDKNRDARNDPRIIRFFEKEGKLKKP